VASITRRTTSSGETRYDVRLRLGHQIRSKTFRRRADADRWARQQETRKDLGELVDPRAGAITLIDFARQWLPTRDLRPRTRQLYGHLLARRIAPTFGTTPINRITTEAVRSWHAEVTRDVSALQAAKAYRLLRAMLNTATADGLIVGNPCCIAGAGQERSPERPLVEPADVLRLADVIEPRYRALVLLAAIGGLRVGELLGLRRRHVDVNEATVRVDQQAIELIDGTRIITEPKSKAGRRTVAVPDVVVDALKVHLEQFTAPDRDAWVFVGERGQPLRRITLQRAWTAARGATAMTHITLHDLRHAGATLAAWTGASTKELMARLGHSTPRAALRYQHAAHHRDREIADRLGQLFEPDRDVTDEPRDRRAMEPQTRQGPGEALSL
jgi:integrase